MSWVELLGFVTGASCVWLAARQNVWTFPVGIANNVAFAALFVPAGLYADAGLQVVYLVLGGLGWWWWSRGGAEGSELSPNTTPERAWPWLALGVVAGTAVIYAVLTSHTDSTVAGWDALTTGLSLVAQVMLNRKWTATWWVWIVADVIYVGLYWHKDLHLTALLYLGFLALCVHGLRTWRRAERAAAQERVTV